jgi:hypothetical protein
MVTNRSVSSRIKVITRHRAVNNHNIHKGFLASLFLLSVTIQGSNEQQRPIHAV